MNSHFQLIISELGWRLGYVGVLIISLNLVWYLTTGLQFEYVSSMFETHYKFSEFSFETFKWQWVCLNKETDKAFMSNEFNVLVYQSKSWSFLNLASMMYFYGSRWEKVTYDFVIFNQIIIYVIGFLLIQSHAFFFPGFVRLRRQMLWIECLVFGLCYALVFDMSLYLCTLDDEFSIERFDSELLKL
jgi:hypothetical protein